MRSGKKGAVAINVTGVQITPKEIRRRIRREVMLRRLRRELTETGEITTVLRRPFSL